MSSWFIEIIFKKGLQFTERDEVGAVVKVHMSGARHDVQFFRFAALELRITLFGGFDLNLFPLFRSQRLFQSVPAGSAHIVQAHRSDGFQPRIDFGSADRKTAAAADSDSTDALPVDERAGAELIHRRAEGFRIEVG